MARSPKKLPAPKSRLLLKMFLLGGFLGVVVALFFFARQVGRNYLQEGSLTRATHVAVESIKDGATQAMTNAVIGPKKDDEPATRGAAAAGAAKDQPRPPAEMSRAELEREVKRLNEEILGKDQEIAELTIQLRLTREGSKTK